MKIEELPLSAIKPYEKNPRKNEGAVDGVAESIKQFGFQQPIVVDAKGTIIVGHTRYKAAQKLGLQTVPCVRADQLTKEQVKAYRILDNKLNELAAWNFEALADELKSFEFDFQGFNVELPKFDFSDLFEPKPSPAPTTSSNDSSSVPFVGESEIPEELRGVDLQPSALAPIKGDDATRMDRVIIVFQASQKDEVAEWLGVEKLDKVVYNFDEFKELKKLP